MTVECICGRPTAGAWLCDHCCGTLAYAIPNIAAYYEDLETMATKRARYGDQAATKGSIGKAQPLPVDGRFVDITGDGTQLRWDAWNTVTTWCRVVMEDQPAMIGPACKDCIHLSCTAARRRRWPSNTIRSMCAYLDRQFRWIVREEWAPDILDELTNLENRLARFIDRPPDRWYAGRCSSTDLTGNTCQMELYATADRGTITCRGCGTEHDVATRRDFLLNQAKDYLVTATEAAGALLAWTDYDGSEAKLVDRVRKWRDRGRLESHGGTVVSGQERHLYRLGDVQELLIEHAQSEQQRRIGA